MEKIKLVSPTTEYIEDIAALRNEITKANDGDAFAGCSRLEKFESIEEWLKNLEILADEETCPEGMVPSNVYLAVREADNKIVGIIDLRHHIDHPILGWWGGHMGYTVRPCERRKGYAKEILRLNLQNCRDMNIEKVMITCKSDNIASEKTIIANGGVFEKEITVDGEEIKRYWIIL